MDPADHDPPLVGLRGVTKSFGGVVACDGVDLELHRGRIHGILGENGAGKSTLMKVLIGLVLPDAGTITVDGTPCRITDPTDAAGHGIGMVHQHFSLVEPLTVWENVALGDAGPLDPAAMRTRIGEIADHYGLDVDPDARVADLPAGLRQRVEIVKCLRRDPEIIVLDEPTSVLTPAESSQLFEALRRVVEREGRAVALVSHKLDEILRATDDVTVMRAGRVVARHRTAETSAAELARDMVGRPAALERAERGRGPDGDPGSDPNPEPCAARPALRISGAAVTGAGGRRLLDGLDLEVASGEIVGVAGVDGNGQRPLADVLSSLVRLDAGRVEVGGISVRTGRPGAMAAAGVGVVPEDRHDSGIVLDMTVAENLALVDPGEVATRGILDGRALRARAAALIERFGIACAGPDAPMWTLSGGNQQRVVLARELSRNPLVLVAAQPTRGLDVGAIADIDGRLQAAAGRGVAVVLISSDLDEILRLASRVVVLHRGHIVGETPRAEATAEQLGLLMGGATA